MSKEIFIFRTYEDYGVLTDSDSGKKYNLLLIPGGKFILNETDSTITASFEHMEETVKLTPYGTPSKLFEIGSTVNLWNYIEDELEGKEDAASLFSSFISKSNFTESEALIGVDILLCIVINSNGVKYVTETDTGIVSEKEDMTPLEASDVAQGYTDALLYERE